MSGSSKRNSKKRKKKNVVRAGRKPGTPVTNQLREGMPARDSVRAVVDFQSPQGYKGKILKTDEIDAYDQLPPKKKRR